MQTINTAPANAETHNRPAAHQQGQLPVGSASAYDNRTAWLMACLSQLAYEPFDQPDELHKILASLVIGEDTGLKDQDPTPLLAPDFIGATPEKSSIKIIGRYDVNDTQALLISTHSFLVLVFRGTEANSFTDLKTGANAVITTCPSGGGIHSGYNDAYTLVEQPIQTDLNSPDNRDKPLIITGHSLGGALATIAAKRLPHNRDDDGHKAYNGQILACYSFGSPHIGNARWSHGITVPVYRIVNALDYFTQLPPGGDVIGSFKFIAGRLPFIGPRLRDYLTRYQGYTHAGFPRHLTDCPPNHYDNVQLSLEIPLWERSRIWLRSKTLRKSVRDHSIAIYRKKLAIIAARDLGNS